MAQSENQLTHREAQEERLERAESTVRRLEQEVEELESMIKKVVLHHDARYEEIRSSADGLIQAKREETDLAVRETAHLTFKPRSSALRRMQALECAVQAKAELQKIKGDIPKHKPDEDVRPGGAHGESQGKSLRELGSQPGGAKGQVHLDGHGNDERLRASRCERKVVRQERVRGTGRVRAMTSSTKS